MLYGVLSTELNLRGKCLKTWKHIRPYAYSRFFCDPLIWISRPNGNQLAFFRCGMTGFWLRSTAWKVLVRIFRILVRIFPHSDLIRRDSVRMQENTDQNNSEYEHFLCSEFSDVFRKHRTRTLVWNSLIMCDKRQNARRRIIKVQILVWFYFVINLMLHRGYFTRDMVYFSDICILRATKRE